MSKHEISSSERKHLREKFTDVRKRQVEIARDEIMGNMLELRVKALSVKNAILSQVPCYEEDSDNIQFMKLQDKVASDILEKIMPVNSNGKDGIGSGNNVNVGNMNILQLGMGKQELSKVLLDRIMNLKDMASLENKVESGDEIVTDNELDEYQIKELKKIQDIEMER